MLKTRNIILDTQYFMSKQFNFEHTELKSLQDIVEKGLAFVYLTDITEREIRKKIADEISKAFQLLKNRDIRYLNIVPSFSDFKEFYNEKVVVEIYEAKLNQFIKDCKVQIIPSSSLSIMEIFEDYCQMQPPFNDKVDKKTEFPDAFAIAAIKEWVKKEDQRAYLLTKDNDWKLFANNYHHGLHDGRPLECIDRMVVFTSKIYHNEKQLRNLAEFSDILILKNEKMINAAVLKRLREKASYTNESYTEASIISFNILDVTMTDKDILNCSRESAVYSLTYHCTGIFDYEVTHYEGAIWDDEEGIYRGLRYEGICKKHTFEIIADISFRYKDGIDDNFEIESFAPGHDYSINFDDEDSQEVRIEEWNEQIPVQIIGVQDGKIMETGQSSMTFKDIHEARKTFPDLDIYNGSESFTQAFSPGSLNEQLRFATKRLSSELWKENPRNLF